MLFLKNLLLRNFQGCCLLFNYQGSSLFLLIRSSSDILSRRFLFVKNFFHFLFTVCSGSVSPSQVSFNRLSHPHPSVKTFSLCTAICSRILSHRALAAFVLFFGLFQRHVLSYHSKSELSMFFVFFIFFAQFRQFTFLFISLCYLLTHAALPFPYPLVRPHAFSNSFSFSFALGLKYFGTSICTVTY